MVLDGFNGFICADEVLFEVLDVFVDVIKCHGTRCLSFFGIAKIPLIFF